jgi:hypothetical protein
LTSLALCSVGDIPPGKMYPLRAPLPQHPAGVLIKVNRTTKTSAETEEAAESPIHVHLEGVGNGFLMMAHGCRIVLAKDFRQTEEVGNAEPVPEIFFRLDDRAGLL